MVSEPSSLEIARAMAQAMSSTTFEGSSVVVAATAGQVPVAISSGLLMSLKLTNENYSIWNSSILPILNGFNLFAYIANNPPPKILIFENKIHEESTAYKSWWKVDQQILSFFHSTISEAIFLVISKSISSKDAWNALENHFNSKNASRIMDLQRQFYNFSKGNWTTNDYVKSFKGIVKSLATVDQPVLEAAMIFAFLRGLGTDYENFVVSTNANIVHLIFEDVITNIKVHDAYLAYQRSLPSS